MRGFKVIDPVGPSNLEPLSAKQILAPLDLWLVERESEPILVFAAVFLGSFGYQSYSHIAVKRTHRSHSNIMPQTKPHKLKEGFYARQDDF